MDKDLLDRKPIATPPYVTYKTLQNLLDGFASDGIPSQIDRSVMRSMSGAIQSQVRGTMRFLGLIDSNDKTTAQLQQIISASSEEQRGVWKEILEQSYGFIFLSEDGFSLNTGTLSQLEEKFRAQGIQGDTVNKAVNFFVRLCQQGGVPLSKFITSSSRKSNGQGKSKTVNGKPSRRDDVVVSVNENLPTNVKPLTNSAVNESLTFRQRLLQMMVDKFPTYDAGGSDDAKNAWFNNYMRLLDMLKKDDEILSK